MRGMQFTLDDTTSLRVLNPEDAETLFAVVDANREHLRRWLPWLDATTSAKDSLAFIQRVQAQMEAGHGFACGVFVDGALAGMCGFHEIDRERNSVVIGYWLAEGFQGRGIITRCTRFFIDYAFGECGLDSVSIPAAVKNTRSRAVSERLGLVNTGVKKDAEDLYGVLVDHAVYSITAEEWAAQRR